MQGRNGYFDPHSAGFSSVPVASEMKSPSQSALLPANRICIWCACARGQWRAVADWIDDCGVFFRLPEPIAIFIVGMGSEAV